MKTVDGIYRAGKVELSEIPSDINDNTQVIVTFLEPNAVDLKARGINKAEAEALRGQLSTFSEEWDSEEMSSYDDYDTTKS
jgi:hypothetical protein